VVRKSILIVDDEKNAREGLRAILEDKYDVYVAADAESALNFLKEECVDLLLTDLRMAGKDGLELIRATRHLPDPPVCILMTAYGGVSTAVEAMKNGASDYLTKPLNLDEVEVVIAKHLRSRDVENENRELRKKLEPQESGLASIVGSSAALQRVLETVRQVAPSKASILIEGESGTGKELVARAIHKLSRRANGPLVTVHCAALAPQLLESELFGHEKGAFTGAIERRAGRFEVADGGTLFLDEIGEIDASIQVKLLRFLGEKTFERVGSSKTLTSDVRVIAATNRDLRAMVAAGKFREDLFFRLAVVTIRMPPLRERPEDIPLLVRAFLKEFNRENDKNVQGFSPDAMRLLQTYSWPGNIRELRTAVEHAVVLCRGKQAELHDLPPSILSYAAGGSSPIKSLDAHKIRSDEGVIPKESACSVGELDLHANERRLIYEALARTRGNRTAAAEELGISRRTLHRKIRELGISGKRKSKTVNPDSAQK
jgi:two-component system response regulator AtoC